MRRMREISGIIISHMQMAMNAKELLSRNYICWQKKYYKKQDK